MPRRCVRRGSLFGPLSELSVGVDIIEWKKAKAFYQMHHEKLSLFLHAAEMRFVEKERRPYEALAMIFAAKEAVFKALGGSWMGPEGFRRIKIRPISFKTFSSHCPEGRKLQITFQKSRHHVVACCLPADRAGSPAL